MANTKVTGDVIANGTISTVHIADNVITSDKISGLTTAHITEGANLYYTDARARSAVSVSGNALSYNSSTGVITSNFEESPTFTGIITASSSSSGDYVRLYGSSGTGKWDIYGNGANLRISDNESAGILAVDTGATFGGNVGIGTTSPSHKLDVAGTIRSNTTEGKLILNSTATNGNEYQFISIDSGNLGIYDGTAYRLWIAGSGNVGIGETSPLGKLHVKTTDTASTANSAGNLLVLEDSENGMSILSSTSGAGYILFGDSGDNDIGGILYDHSANAMRFKTNGVWDRMRIDSSGNVGIGTASPETNAKLDVRAGSGGKIVLGTYDANYKVVVEAGDQLNFYNGASATTAYMNYGFSGTPGNILLSRNLFVEANSSGGTSGTVRIKPDGNVGIKTTSPQAQLHINEDTSNSYATLRLEGANRGGIIDMYNAAYPVSRILTDQSGNIYISTSGAFASTSLSEKFTILTGGNVGIGTASPDSILHVESNGSTSANFILESTHSSGIPLLDLKGASSAQLRYKDSSDVIQARIDFDNSGTFNFIDVPNNSSTLYLKTGGNVGIGTTSPDASLDIEPSSGDADILLTAGSQTLRLDQNSIRTTTNNNLTLFTNGNSGQLVLQQSTGNVGIGTTSPAQKLHVVGKMQISDDIKLAQTNGRIDYDNGVSTGALRFWSTSGNSERMRITSAGNVGIGETSPLVPLHISRDSASGENIALLLDNNNTTAGNEIGILFRSAVGSTNTDFEIFGKANGANDMDLVFQSDGSVERMRINGDGNVGIGADSPGTKLEVRQVDDTFDDLDLLTLKRVWSTASGSDRAHGIKFSDNNAILANIYADRTNSGSNYNSDLVFITNTGASGTDTSEKMRIDNGGSIHQNYISGLAGTSDYGFTIAKQTGYSQVYFRADTTSTRYIQRFYNDNSGTLQNVGNIIISGSTTSYATSSDYRLKENVVEMTGALDRISQLKPSRFNFIGDADKTVDGFLAHEVQDIVPEAITGEKDSMRTEEYEVTPVVLDEEGNITEEAVMGTREVPEYQGIDQSKLVPLLVGAIQELKADNDSLRARIEILENQ